MDKKRCGAKKRDGTPCRSWPIKGKTRCRLHGGKSTGPPKGSKNAWKYGIYAAGIKDEEKELYEQIKVGTLDDDIKIIKLQLARAVKAQKELEESKKDAGLETVESKSSSFQKTETGWKKAEVIKKHPDYRKIIFQLSGRIAKLELTRDAIMKDDPRDDKPQPIKIEIITEDGRIQKNN